MLTPALVFSSVEKFKGELYKVTGKVRDEGRHTRNTQGDICPVGVCSVNTLPTPTGVNGIHAHNDL